MWPGLCPANYKLSPLLLPQCWWFFLGLKFGQVYIKLNDRRPVVSKLLIVGDQKDVAPHDVAREPRDHHQVLDLLPPPLYASWSVQFSPYPRIILQQNLHVREEVLYGEERYISRPASSKEGRGKTSIHVSAPSFISWFQNSEASDATYLVFVLAFSLMQAP